MRILLLVTILFFSQPFFVNAQIADPTKMDSLMRISHSDEPLIIKRDTLSDGSIQFQEVVNGDTLIMVYMPDFNVVSRHFKNDNERRRFENTKRKVIKVYPYARKAIDLMNEIEAETEAIAKRRGRKKYKKQLEKELDTRFREDLINLTKSEGRILVDIIERETGRNMFDIIKDLKNPMTAFFYQQIGKRFDYDLKDGYNAEEKENLEIIIKGIEANGEDWNSGFDIF